MEKQTCASFSHAADPYDELISRIRALSLSDFGEITPLDSPFPAPPVYPKANTHPRVLVTPETLPTVRANLTHPENAAMYAKYLELANVETDGVLKKTNGYDQHNMDYDLLTVIESKAFRYLMEGNKRDGYGAILAMKNFLVTLSIPLAPVRTIFDYCRAFGYTMYTAALVYDWCYDLLTPEDCEQLTAGVETKLAPNFEMGFPPLRQGGVTGHGTEAQLYRDWLVYAIASYDEYPDIYEFVAGRLHATHRDAANFYMRSGAHWQGTSYGPYRYYFLLVPQAIFSKMTNGEYGFFSDDLHRVAYFLLHTLRPDGDQYQMGDGKGLPQYRAASFFLASALYRDPVLKGYAKQNLNGFTDWTNRSYSAQLTPVMFLCLNDPTVVPVENYMEHLPLVAYFGSPRGNMIARSAWGNKDAASVYMKIGEAYSGNHEHKDAGHFMIYYKSPLVTDSGVYGSRYGCKHDRNYLKQTISHNCMLIYNPAFDNSAEDETYRFLYSGGQKLKSGGEFHDLLEWTRWSASRQAKILGADYKAEMSGEDETYRWSYIAGDLTNAYDGETVEDYGRYMLSVMTDDAENPMAFFVFDRVTVTDPAFKKTFLLHTQAAPTVDHENARATVVFGEGKLHLQTLLGETVCEVIGGLKGDVVDGVENDADKQFWVLDRNYYAEDDPNYQIPEQKEAGWGRMEISPTAKEKTTRMLNVMYVTDAANEAPAIPASEIKGDGLVGAEILGKTVLFPSDAKSLSSAASFMTAATEGETEYFIAGLKPGRWSISLNGGSAQNVTVGKSGILNFKGAVGSVTVAPAP